PRSSNAVEVDRNISNARLDRKHRNRLTRRGAAETFTFALLVNDGLLRRCLPRGSGRQGKRRYVRSGSSVGVYSAILSRWHPAPPQCLVQAEHGLQPGQTDHDLGILRVEQRLLGNQHRSQVYGTLAQPRFSDVKGLL